MDDLDKLMNKIFHSIEMKSSCKISSILQKKMQLIIIFYVSRWFLHESQTQCQIHPVCVCVFHDVNSAQILSSYFFFFFFFQS